MRDNLQAMAALLLRLFRHSVPRNDTIILVHRNDTEIRQLDAVTLEVSSLNLHLRIRVECLISPWLVSGCTNQRNNRDSSLRSE